MIAGFLFHHGRENMAKQSSSDHGGQGAERQDVCASDIFLPSPFISSRLPACTHEGLRL